MKLMLGGKAAHIEAAHLVVAGWTGRDPSAIAYHVEELAALGVAPPSTTPLFYRVSAPLLTTANHIQVVGEDSSGEVEPVVLHHQGQRWLGIGSDHTDRALEAHSIALSKQICLKPCAAEFWAWEEVTNHLDDIKLESWITQGGEWVPYQQGGLASILPLKVLIEDANLNALAEEGSVVLMCGTLGAIGGVRPAERFRMRMSDPITGRAIGHEYAVTVLPVVA
jgi:hypothetical protein